MLYKGKVEVINEAGHCSLLQNNKCITGTRAYLVGLSILA